MLDQFTKGAWDIRTYAPDNRRPVAQTVIGYRYRDFAVHRKWMPDGKGRSWRVTHLPTGNCFPFDFPTLNYAAMATIAIDRVRNHWDEVDQDDIRAMKERVIQICLMSGGIPTRASAPQNLNCTLNGYGG